MLTDKNATLWLGSSDTPAAAPALRASARAASMSSCGVQVGRQSASALAGASCKDRTTHVDCWARLPRATAAGVDMRGSMTAGPLAGAWLVGGGGQKR